MIYAGDSGAIKNLLKKRGFLQKKSQTPKSKKKCKINLNTIKDVSLDKRRPLNNGCDANIPLVKKNVSAKQVAAGNKPPVKNESIPFNGDVNRKINNDSNRKPGAKFKKQPSQNAPSKIQKLSRPAQVQSELLNDNNKNDDDDDDDEEFIIIIPIERIKELNKTSVNSYTTQSNQRKSINSIDRSGKGKITEKLQKRPKTGNTGYAEFVKK